MRLYKTPFPAGMKYQYATIPARSRGTVYRFTNWGMGFRAFIDQVGIGPDCLPWNLIHFIWLVDGGAVEDFQYQISPVNSPKHYDPPLVAHRIIEWIGINNDVLPHTLEVLTDGQLVMKPLQRVC